MSMNNVAPLTQFATSMPTVKIMTVLISVHVMLDILEMAKRAMVRLKYKKRWLILEEIVRWTPLMTEGTGGDYCMKQTEMLVVSFRV